MIMKAAQKKRPQPVHSSPIAACSVKPFCNYIDDIFRQKVAEIIASRKEYIDFSFIVRIDIKKARLKRRALIF